MGQAGLESRRRLSSSYIRQAVIASVHPRLDYASTVWYKPGQTKDLVAMLERVNADAAKLVAGLPRSASGAADGVETHLRPTHLRLTYRSHNAATHVKAAPPTSLPSTSLPTRSQTFGTRTDTWLFARRSSWSTHPPPWAEFEPPETSIAESKDDAAEKHDQLIASLEPEGAVPYSDGSMMEGRGLGTQQTVYSAELDGITLAMRMLLHAPPATRERRIVICVDNQAAVRVATSTRTGPGQAQRIEIRRLYLELKEELELKSIKLQWVPGHVEIDGNELADEAAKEATKATDDESIKQGLEIEQPNTIPASRVALRQQFETRVSQVWAREWKNGKTGRAASQARRLTTRAAPFQAVPRAPTSGKLTTWLS
ncbi:BQ2448_6213 [Microbotryum intermedium]|uniref:ribonuclease H n=1 Tax=Microbotryum intermedium TaxID=269621 RepID=A0A238FP50_9BASI|nr:BQ2448_6213 [Microbotryum intermedium]